MYRGLISAVCVAALLLSADLAGAEVIATEDFESYAVDELIENLNPSPAPGPYGTVSSNDGSGGAGWSAAWDVNTAEHVTTDSIERGLYVESGGLSYSSGEISIDGGNRRLQHRNRVGSTTAVVATRALPSQTSTTYLSFLYRPTDVGSGDFLQVGFSDDTSNAEASALLDESGGGGLSTRAGTSGEAEIPNVTFDAGTTYLIVIKVHKAAIDDTGPYTVTMFVNPDSLTETGGTNLSRSASNGDATGLGSVDYLVLRKSALETGERSEFDEFRIATTFGEAVAPVPEPATLALLGLGGLAMAGLRRRRS